MKKNLNIAYLNGAEGIIRKNQSSSGSGESDELLRSGYSLLCIADEEQFVNIELNKMKIVEYQGNDNKPILKKINFEYDGTNNVYVLLKSDWRDGMNFLVDVTTIYAMGRSVSDVILKQNDIPVNANYAAGSMGGFTSAWEDITSGAILSRKYNPSTDTEYLDAVILLFTDPTSLPSPQ